MLSLLTQASALPCIIHAESAAVCCCLRSALRSSAAVYHHMEQFTLRQYQSEGLPEATIQQLLKGSAAISTVSEHVYDQYLRLMNKEQDPELIINIPQQQQQQQLDLSKAAESSAACAPAGSEPPAALPGTAPADSGGPPAGTPGPAVVAAAAAAAAAAAGGGTPPPPAAPEAATTTTQQQQQQLAITIVFSKPACSGSRRDASLLVSDGCLAANAQLRRSRGWFPCVDSPLYCFTPGAQHYLPYTFSLHVTVPPSCMAVCSGSLVQQTCVEVAAAGGSSTHQAGDGGSSTAPVIAARTFEYAVSTAVVPSQLSIAVGPFVEQQQQQQTGCNPQCKAHMHLPERHWMKPQEVSKHVLRVVTLRTNNACNSRNSSSSSAAAKC